MTGGLQRPALQAAGHPSFESVNTPEETKSGKYLTFILADEDCGISLLKAREIIGMMPITSVPRTPDFVMSIINLRGEVIPVSDLRLRFGMSESIYTDRTCITVVEVEGHDRMVQMGTVVDDDIFRRDLAAYISSERIFTSEVRVRWTGQRLAICRSRLRWISPRSPSRRI